MTTRLQNSITVSIPDIRQEIAKIPNVAQCREQFLDAFRLELSWCIMEALRATEGQVIFSDLRVPFSSLGERTDGQYIMEFEVFDRSKPSRNSYNWHGQNTSQWIYAGCILYEEGSVSRHH